METYISNPRKQKKILYIIILFFFSTLINHYYGNLGVCPIDSFWFFNSGYDTLNGRYPFKDYWTIAGPFITIVQAFFFKILGVSWFSYVLHASIFNFLISISTFYTLHKFKLNINCNHLNIAPAQVLAPQIDVKLHLFQDARKPQKVRFTIKNPDVYDSP